MKRRFLKERASWISFIFFLHGLILFVAYVDQSLTLSQIGYPLLLSSILFVFFIVYRYYKESRFYQQLEQYDQHEQLSDLPDGQSPFETMVETAFEEQRNHLFQKYMIHRQQVDNDKDEMMAWIHEVKTPLTTMGLIIDRLEEKEANTALHLEWLRIHLLLDQKLYQKRMDFIENDLYLDKVELESVFHQEIRTFQQWCMQKGIGIELELKEPFVYSDAKWLAFLIRQILSNAVKYSYSGDISISSQSHNGQIELLVKDEGKGIAEQDLSRIFEKGFTSTTFHHEQAASGMGLYLAKKVADGLAIQLTVQSTLEKGTMVTMLFPRKNDFTSLTSM
ncbi:sensor histidine kinase [Bacillus sp. Marseille-P3800]|uniref:sensor histidine kinase n=1 Tax=Bacillus sp. Marseille-P3800 TaxID=2014782 RepID=UPI000C076822|nr:sensor histidine kinase [Bacillus sp. Marseille-P3800]